MGNNMGFQRLIYITICIFLFQNCSKSPKTSSLTYKGYRINKPLPKDYILPDINLTLKVVDNQYYFDVQDSSSVDSGFVVIEDKGKMRFRTFKCDKEAELLLEDLQYDRHFCEGIYPFTFGKITLLDTKKIKNSHKDYEVLKISNENYEESTVVYWVKRFGLIMIGMDNGVFYDLVDINGESSSDLEFLIREMKKDASFSGQRKTPPLPLLPPRMENE